MEWNESHKKLEKNIKLIRECFELNDVSVADGCNAMANVFVRATKSCGISYKEYINAMKEHWENVKIQ